MFGFIFHEWPRKPRAPCALGGERGITLLILLLLLLLITINPIMITIIIIIIIITDLLFNTADFPI